MMNKDVYCFHWSVLSAVVDESLLATPIWNSWPAETESFLEIASNFAILLKTIDHVLIPFSIP